MSVFESSDVRTLDAISYDVTFLLFSDENLLAILSDTAFSDPSNRRIRLLLHPDMCVIRLFVFIALCFVKAARKSCVSPDAVS